MLWRSTMRLMSLLVKFLRSKTHNGVSYTKDQIVSLPDDDARAVVVGGDAKLGDGPAVSKPASAYMRALRLLRRRPPAEVWEFTVGAANTSEASWFSTGAYVEVVEWTCLVTGRWEIGTPVSVDTPAVDPENTEVLLWPAGTVFGAGFAGPDAPTVRGGRTVELAAGETYVLALVNWSADDEVGSQWEAPRPRLRVALSETALDVGLSTTGWNTFVGDDAGDPDCNAFGNTGVGAQALRSVVSGGSNTGVGWGAQRSITHGDGNTGVGMNAQTNTVDGIDNTGVGVATQSALTSGQGNTGVGARVQQSLTDAVFNTGVGMNAQNALTFGAENTAAGVSSQGNLTTGSRNTAAGVNSQLGLTTGADNTGVGMNAQNYPRGVAANKTTTASRQTCVGARSGQSVASQVDDITTVGYQAAAGATKGTALGSGATAGHVGSVALGSDTATTSDAQVMVGPRDVELTDATKGVVLKSPNGTRWRVKVSDAGALTVTAV